MNRLYKKEIAECVGLWLAEGDKKTLSEVTFTNNCWTLVKMFYKFVINKFDGNPRIYVYSEKLLSDVKLGKCKIKYYLDKRSNKPYYILRLASRAAIKEWHLIVKKMIKKRELYPYILRGFFAGEGNVKANNSESSHKSRILRVAQKVEEKFINNLLNSLNITYRFNKNNRCYEISGKWNWDIFAECKLAYLHPDKRKNFISAYKSYKEDHYSNLFLKNITFKKLNKPKTAKELGLTLNRSQARICDVLMELKKEGKARDFKVRSQSYWINNDMIVISKIKAKYLSLLKNNFRQTSDFANKLKVNWKSSFRRLNELEKLGLVKSTNYGWQIINKGGGIYVK